MNYNITSLGALALFLALLLPLPAYAPHPLQVPVLVEQEHPDLDLLARLIAAEARGECLTGQVAVGAVVLNRVDSPHFPGTIEGVIYQPGQFEPVSRGTISREPSERSMEAARRALRGEIRWGIACIFTIVNWLVADGFEAIQRRWRWLGFMYLQDRRLGFCESSELIAAMGITYSGWRENHRNPVMGDKIQGATSDTCVKKDHQRTIKTMC